MFRRIVSTVAEAELREVEEEKVKYEAIERGNQPGSSQRRLRESNQDINLIQAVNFRVQTT